jgi:phosphoribosyl-dephospho-CoA transferase
MHIVEINFIDIIDSQLDDVSRVGDQLSARSALDLCRLTHVCPRQREEHMHVLG